MREFVMGFARIGAIMVIGLIVYYAAVSVIALYLLLTFDDGGDDVYR
jgi:hypothetical protein